MSFLVPYHCKHCLIYLTVLTGIKVYTNEQTSLSTIISNNLICDFRRESSRQRRPEIESGYISIINELDAPMTNDVGVIGATYIANGKALAYLFTQINLPSHQLKCFRCENLEGCKSLSSQMLKLGLFILSRMT